MELGKCCAYHLIWFILLIYFILWFILVYSTDEANFPHKILRIIRQVTNFWKAFGEKSSANIKLSKPQMSKIIQSGGLLGWLLLGTIMKVVLPFMKKLIQPLTKKVLIPLGLTAA